MDKFTITYGNEVTEQVFSVGGEETVDGVACWIIEYSYRPPASRVPARGETAVTLIGGKLWVGKVTQEWVKVEAYNELMDTKVTMAVTNPYRIRQPLSVGKSWFYESTARMIPEFAPPSTNRYRADVVCQEDVSVPAGSFTAYRVEYGLVGADGVEVNPPLLETIMWFAVDTSMEIKRETYTMWKQTEIAELAAVDGYQGIVNRDITSV